MFKEKLEEEVKEKKGKKLVALKDFKFMSGKDIYEIKKGEEVNVPKVFLPNLKTEKVIK